MSRERKRDDGRVMSDEERPLRRGSSGGFKIIFFLLHDTHYRGVYAWATASRCRQQHNGRRQRSRCAYASLATARTRRPIVSLFTALLSVCCRSLAQCCLAVLSPSSAAVSSENRGSVVYCIAAAVQCAFSVAVVVSFFVSSDFVWKLRRRHCPSRRDAAEPFVVATKNVYVSSHCRHTLLVISPCQSFVGYKTNLNLVFIARCPVFEIYMYIF